MDDIHIQYLVEQYLKGVLTTAERLEFQELAADIRYHKQLLSAFDRLLEEIQPVEESDEALLPLVAQILDRDRGGSVTVVEEPSKRTLKIWNTVWVRSVAALLVAIMGVAIWLWISRIEDTPLDIAEIAGGIAPGEHKAVLTLGDGRTFYLNGTAGDTLAEFAGATILKEDKEGIAYQIVDDHDYAAAINTITTPRGGQYRVVLADGTKIWLNAASSISFPVNFSGEERIVKLTGEAYFEVNTISEKVGSGERKTPFIVKVNDMQVRVLGTSFNINSYDRASLIETTLLEGAVAVSQGKISSEISPGQHAKFYKESGQFEVSDADIGHIMAWKEGRFEFNGSLKDIMGQVSRWYDIDVVFEMDGAGKDQLFIGSISRSSDLGKVLKMIEMTGDVNFKIENQKIIVMD